jgi:hypothetical protein
MKNLSFGIVKHPKKNGKLIGCVQTENGTKYVTFPKGKLTLTSLVLLWARDKRKFRHLKSLTTKQISKTFKTA